MSKITEISVRVTRTLSLDKGEYVSYSCAAKANVEDLEAPVQVYEETLAFCQDKIIREMERIERGDPPKPSTSVYNEDYIPDFKPLNK